MKLFKIKGKINKFATNVRQQGLIGASKIYRDNVLLQNKERELRVHKKLAENEARKDAIAREKQKLDLENLKRDNGLAKNITKTRVSQNKLAATNAKNETIAKVGSTRATNERRYGVKQDTASKLQDAIDVISNKDSTVAEIKSAVNDKQLLNSIAGLSKKELQRVASKLRKPEKELVNLLHKYSKGDVISVRQFVNKGRRIRTLNLERAGEVIGSAVIAAATTGAVVGQEEDDDANS